MIGILYVRFRILEHKIVVQKTIVQSKTFYTFDHIEEIFIQCLVLRDLLIKDFLLLLPLCNNGLQVTMFSNYGDKVGTIYSGDCSMSQTSESDFLTKNEILHCTRITLYACTSILLLAGFS